MQVIGLRHAGPARWMIGQLVSLDDRDPSEVPTQRLGGDEPGHARAQYHGVFVRFGASLVHAGYYRFRAARVHLHGISTGSPPASMCAMGDGCTMARRPGSSADQGD